MNIVKRSSHELIYIAIIMGVFIIISILSCLPKKKVTIYRTNGVNSSELILQKTIEGNIKREDYLSNKGVIIFAADKHYATVIKELDEEGHVIREFYYDENGNPALQSSGYAGILHGYDETGKNNTVTYIDAAGEPMMTTYGYASINRVFDENGNIIKESYIDLNGQLVKSTSGYYSRIREYDEEGNCILVSYLDESEDLTVCTSGYATEKRTLDSAGRTVAAMYYDEYDKPVQNMQGVYGIAYDYDNLGRKFREMFLDADGNIMPNSYGYAIVEKTFGADNSVETEMYFDEDYQPVRLSHGQYGIKRVDGEVRYLDVNGNEVFYLDQFLHSNPLLVVIAGILVCLLGMFLPHKLKICLLILYVLFIVLMTLMYRGSGDSEARLELFWSYKDFFIDRSARVDIIKNIWLFVPLGVLLYFLSSRRWMLLVPVLLSVIIEVVQFITGRGLFEFDDIISNGLGGCLGFYFGELLQTILTKMKQKTDSFEMNNDLNNEQDQMLAIIRMALWGREEPSVSMTPEIYQELKTHGIASLIIPILSKIDMTEELQQGWEKTKLHQIAHYIQYNHVQNNLPVNVPYVILKGSAAAMYYPHPELRAMGDIDIMTRREDFDLAYQQLSDNGFRVVKQLEREIGLVKNGIMIELHWFFALLSDPVQAAYMDNLVIDNINPSHILPDLVNGLVLLEHINQHLESGLGLRQIIDWMMFVNKCLPDERWTEFREMSDQIGLTTLAIVTTRMCEIFLGLSERSWSCAADTNLCKQLLQYILSCGNFGNKKIESEDVAENVFSFTKTPKAAFELLQKRGLANWKTAQKYRFFRPFAWIYQSGRYVTRGLKRKGAVQKLKGEYESAMRKNDMLDALEVKQLNKGRMVYRDGKYVRR